MTSPIRTVVTFQSNEFNTTESPEHFINPGNFGDDLCKWLAGELGKEGVQTDAEPGQEDFGWYFNYSIGSTTYCLVCGFRPGDENDAGLWIAWIERSAGFFSSLFGGRDKGIDIAATRAIHDVLAKSEAVSNIRWHYKKDFEGGNVEAGTDNPEG